jgi:thiol-disulfide isomerase/thioredoxin
MGAGEHPVRVGVILALIAVLCAAGSSIPSHTTSDSLGVGTQVFEVGERTPAPSLSGTTITGAPFDLAEELGHGLVAVNVWASWCGPCREEMPVLAHAADGSLRVVGIDERDNSRSARAFASSRGARYPSLADPHGRLLALLRMLPQAGIPSTLFLDLHGRVAARVIGPVDRNVLGRILRRLGASS